MIKDGYTLFEQLQRLISDTNNKEHECRNYLQHAKISLVTNTVKEFIYVENERRGHSGDSDYVISCRVCDETGVEAVKAYIWELKAPQCYIFEKDTESRLRPSKELIQAENQLLYYYHENKGSEQFKNDFCITHSDNVLFGGIIIGCQSKRIRGNIPADKMNKLYQEALMIRKKYIYDPHGIKIFTWDYILELLKPYGIPMQEKVEKVEITQLLDTHSSITFTTSSSL
jgi:hypothetical protein